MLLPEGSVPVNAKVVEIINIVKPQAIELIEYANNVRWEMSTNFFLDYLLIHFWMFCF